MGSVTVQPEGGIVTAETTCRENRMEILQNTIVIGSLCSAAGLLVLFIANRSRERRTLEHLNQMLDDAIAGTFSEKTYDETYLSALEIRMAQYLKKNENALEKLSQHQDKISTLISDISHQTKTPLANISLYAELLLEKQLSEDARGCAEHIHTQTEKLQFLIGALIQTSRLENGIIRLEPEFGTVDDMLENAAAQAEEKAERKCITILLPEKSKRHTAVFDEKWTREALVNLLDNAVKYTCEGDMIEVNINPYELFLRIDVTDHGPGISEAEQAKIFGRFYRGENAKNTEGVGIGLYLTSQIVNGEGGYLKVKSEVGNGTTFSMFLPRK